MGDLLGSSQEDGTSTSSLTWRDGVHREVAEICLLADEESVPTLRTAIVYVTDQKGYELTRHSAASALLTQTAHHDVHIFCNAFRPEPHDALIALARGVGVRLAYHSIEGAKVSQFECFGHVTTTALLKFDAMDRMSREYDRVLYLDGDVLLFHDLALDSIALDRNVIGAVYDIAECGGLTDPHFHNNCEKAGRSPHYFNNGLMLADCRAWHETPTLRSLYDHHLRAHATSCDYKSNCVTTDQCVFNRVFECAWKRLPLSFNLQGCALFTEHWDHAPVRHYVGPRKFLPVRRWRTDNRDLDLLAHIRASLKLPKLGGAGSGMAYELNRLRNRALVRTVNEALVKVEMMAAQGM